MSHVIRTVWGDADTEAICWLFRKSEIEHPKQMYERERAPRFSSQTKHCFMVFVKTLQAWALLLLCNRVGPSSSREQRTATQSFSIEGNSLKRAGEEVEHDSCHPWFSKLRCTFSSDYVSHINLNLCKTGMKLLIYFIWGLWSLINICAYFQMTGAL